MTAMISVARIDGEPTADDGPRDCKLTMDREPEIDSERVRPWSLYTENEVHLQRRKERIGVPSSGG